MIESKASNLSSADDGNADSQRPPSGVARFESRRERCPTCGAARGGDDRVCHRCATDLSLIHAVEARADNHYRSALQAYAAGRFRTAAGEAVAASKLEERPEFLRLLAVASLRCGDFLTTVKAARKALVG